MSVVKSQTIYVVKDHVIAEALEALSTAEFNHDLGIQSIIL